MTRLEKIRSMSAEELGGEMAHFDWDYCRPEYCPHFHEDGCITACIRYLNEEIEDK